MDAIIVLLSVFGIFIPALILPGPDFIAVVRSSMTYGTRAGLLTTLGVSSGLCFYATLSILGLSAILSEYQWLTWVVRVLGGGYLIYLGIKLLRARPTTIDLDADDRPAGSNSVLFGFLVTLTNPKAIVLFSSVFATAVTPATPPWLMFLMIALVTGAALIWYAIVTLFMSSAPVVGSLQHAKHWIERVAGVCFIGIGGRILADARNPVTP